MKEKCTPCMGSEIKGAIREMKDIGLDKAIEKIPDCPEPREMQMCIKPPRAKSQYQLFIGDCMRSKPIKGKPFGEASKYMKECAVQWKKTKEGR